MSSQEIFEAVYRNKSWGGRWRFWQRFYSGRGSTGSLAEKYCKAVAPLLNGKVVVDIGCGDFNIGRKLVKSSCQYIACDIVKPLIEYNRKKFKGVDFRVLDATRDDLPDGDIVLIREVLQHLDNSSVSKVLDKLSKYQSAIITEHVPPFNFTPNIDKPINGGDRTLFRSGLVLTEAPFFFPSGKVICEARRKNAGVVRTIHHQL